MMLLRTCDTTDSKCPLQTSSCGILPDLTGLPRKTARWNQRGWVAADEMIYYLGILERNGICKTTPPLILADNEMGAVALGNWINQATQIATSSTRDAKMSTAILLNNHWIPLMLDITQETLALHTSTSSVHTLINLASKAFAPEEVPLSIKHSLTYQHFQPTVVSKSLRGSWTCQACTFHRPRWTPTQRPNGEQCSQDISHRWSWTSMW